MTKLYPHITSFGRDGLDCISSTNRLSLEAARSRAARILRLCRAKGLRFESATMEIMDMDAMGEHEIYDDGDDDLPMIETGRQLLMMDDSCHGITRIMICFYYEGHEGA